MATQGSYEEHVYGTAIQLNRIWLGFSWERKSYSYVNNTSTINWSVTLRAGGIGGGTTLAQHLFKVIIDGVEYDKYHSGDLPAQSTITVATGTATIPHNADGSKSFDFVVDTHVAEKHTKISANYKLDTLPRISTINNITAYIEEENGVVINFKNEGALSSGITHNLYYNFGDVQIIAEGLDYLTTKSYSWTLPASIYELIPNAQSIAGHIMCRTFYNGNEVGDSYGTLTAKTQESRCMPEITSFTAQDTNDTTYSLTKDRGTVVRYHSTVGYSATGITKNHATVKEYICKNGNTQKHSPISSFTNAESNTTYITLMDSRGYASELGISNLKFVEYSHLTCNLSNEPPENNGKLICYVKGNYFNGKFGDASGAAANTLTIAYRYQINDGEFSGYQAVIPTISGNSYSATITLNNVVYTDNYNIEVVAEDKLEAKKATKIIKTSSIFDWGENDFNFNVDVSLAHNKGIYGETKDGMLLRNIIPCNQNNDFELGYGGYANEIGSTFVEGNNVIVKSKNKLNLVRVNTKGNEGSVFGFNDGSDNLYVGYQNYNAKQGSTGLYGDDVSIYTNKDLKINNTKSLLGLYNAMTGAYNLSTTIAPGSYYGTSIVVNSARLIGNVLYVNISGERTSATSGTTEDIVNEIVVRITVNHGGKIVNLYNTNNNNGHTGELAAFYTTTAGLDDLNSSTTEKTFDVYLACASIGFKKFNLNLAIPVTINPSKYV